MKRFPLVDGKKVCRDCSTAYPPTAEFFSMSRGRPTSYCKPCAAERARVHYWQNHAHGLEVRTAYREAHRGEWTDYFRRYAAENAERRKAISRAWRDKNSEAILSRKRARYRSNPRPFVESARRWAQLNPEKARVHTLRKNHRRRGAPLDAEARAYTVILRQDPCSYCGLPMTRPEIDHIVPLHSGGRGNWENLTAACRRCNLAKAGKSLLTFLWERCTG